MYFFTMKLKIIIGNVQKNQILDMKLHSVTMNVIGEIVNVVLVIQIIEKINIVVDMDVIGKLQVSKLEKVFLYRITHGVEMNMIIGSLKINFMRMIKKKMKRNF